MLISADLKCYYCGTVAGEMFADTARPRHVLAFLPAAEPVQDTSVARSCHRCGGPLYMDEAQTISRHEAALRLRRRQTGRPLQRAAAGA
jgi:hypothetical protein